MKVIPFCISMFILLCCSCERDKKVNPKIEIKLEKYAENNPFGTTLRPFRILDSMPSEITGNRLQDSFKISKITLSPSLFKVKPENLVSFYALSGFDTDGQQIVIVDSDMDNDFSNNVISKVSPNYKFEINERLKKPIDSLPLQQIELKIPLENSTYSEKFSFKTLPYYGYFSPIKDSIQEQYRLVGQFNDFWYADFNIEEDSYKIAMNKNIFGRYTILIEEKDNNFKTRRENDYFPFTLKDTVPVNNKFYIISDLDTIQKRLVLDRYIGEVSHLGYRKGRTLKFNYVDIFSNDTIKSTSLNKNKYLLIDFWGTWCAPCKELTPDLMRFSNDYDNLNILSIAYEKNKKNAINYIESKELNWNHTYLNGDPKSRKQKKPSLIQKLKISKYPTFILVDTNNTILHRGTGKEALRQIENIVKSNN